MVSYIQVEGYGLEQGFKGVVKPASGRPKPIRQQEDAENFYVYTRSGKKTTYPKTDDEKYFDFLSKQAQYTNWTTGGKGNLTQVSNNVTDHITRDTPPTEYEIAWGLLENPLYMETNDSPMGINPSHISHPQHPNFNPSRAINHRQKTHQHIRELKSAKLERDRIAEEKAELLRQQKLRETARPKPREVEKPEPVEIEPIKEAVKYSPLMIAGVIAVVVILLLKRRRA